MQQVIDSWEVEIYKYFLNQPFSVDDTLKMENDEYVDYFPWYYELGSYLLSSVYFHDVFSCDNILLQGMFGVLGKIDKSLW